MLRQKSLAGQNLNPLLAQLKQAKSLAKGTRGQGAGAGEDGRCSLPNSWRARDLAALKQVAALRKRAALKAAAPSRSALLARSPWTQNPQPEAEAVEAGQEPGQEHGDRRAEAGEDGRCCPRNSWRASDLAGLKKVAALKKQAALKATAPTRSALVAQKNLLGSSWRPKKATIVRMRAGIKKALQRARLRQSAKKVGAMAKQTQQQTRQRAIDGSSAKGN